MPRAGRLTAPDGSAERVAKLCGSKVIVDVAMDGDRGIVSMFPDFEFALEETIAQGKPICRIVITRKKR